MPRDAEITRKRILDAAYVAFRRRGYARIGVDEIAAAAKVTKRTLYYHFDSKDALLAAVLERQHELAILTWDQFSGPLARQPRRLIAKMFDDLIEWSSQPRWPGSGFSRVAQELADLPGHPARTIASRHKALIETRLADMLAAAGVAMPQRRAREIWILTEGAMTCTLIHRDMRYAEAAKRAALALMGQPVRRTRRGEARSRNAARAIRRARARPAA
jgi:AcrR family transcriptional regulator